MLRSDYDVLLLDEPDNFLDVPGKRWLEAELCASRKTMLYVSHDRELLDTMDAIVEMTALGVRRYGGNWSAYHERKALELAAAQHDLADAEKRASDAADIAQVQAERKARKDATGKRKAARGDMPRIIIGGLKRKAEETSGAMARLAEKQQDRAQADIASARERIEVLQPLTVTLDYTTGASEDVLVRLSEKVTEVRLPLRGALRDVEFNRDNGALVEIVR